MKWKQVRQTLSKIKLNWRLWIALWLVALLLPISLKLLIRPKQSQAAWWNPSWQYRKRINITNSSGSTLTDFQISFTLDTATLITDGKLQSDCDDLRITDQTGKPLPFWIEESNPGCNNASTLIWTKLSSIPTSGSNIYLYYGNSVATISSDLDGSKVFNFFDSFNSGTQKWNDPSCGSVVVSGGKLTWTGTGTGHCYHQPTTAYNPNLTDMITDSYGRVTAASGTRYWGNEVRSSGANRYVGALYPPSACDIRKNTGRIGTGTAACTIDVDTWYHTSAYVVGTNIKIFQNGIEKVSETDASFASGGTGLDYYSSSLATYEIDWVLARKAVATAPTTSLATEETTPGPIVELKFDEGGGNTAKDTSGKNNNGTLNNLQWRSEDQCVSGKCLNFDGGGTGRNISIADSNSLDFGTNSFTISGWALHRDYTYPKTNFAVIKAATCYTSGAANAGFYVGHGYSATGVVACIHDVDNNYVNTTLTFNTAYQPANLKNTWVHYVFVFDRSAGRIKAYVNGVKQTNEIDISSVTGSINNSSALTIGTLYGWTTDGKYDEFKIYPYARSEDQIKADYNQGQAVSIGNIKQSLTSQGLYAYWKTDEATWSGTVSEIIDASGNNNHATAQGATDAKSYPVTGKFGNAGFFDGVDDYIDTPDYLPSSESFSVTAWFNLDSSKAAVNVGYPIFGNNQVIAFLEYNPSTKAFLQLRQYSTGNQSLSWSATSLSNLADSNWHHLVLSVDQTNYTATLYVDGKLLSSQTIGTEGYNHSNGNFRAIGKDWSNYWMGKIDEVRLYKKALTAQEAKEIYLYAPGPIGHWKLDENTGSTANDSSGNSLTGTLANSPTWTKGQFGGSLLFNGAGSNNQEINIPDNDTLDLTGNITAEAWVKWSSFKNYGVILEKGNSGSAATFNYAIWSYDNQLTAFIANGTGSNSVSYASSNISLNVWHHIAMVADGSKLRLFIDGKQVNATTQTVTPYANTYPLRISYSGYAINGAIDEVKIYNYARTTQQIVQDMNAGHPAGGSPIGSQLLYWKLDEGTSTSVYDSSGNNYTGTIACTGTGCTVPTWESDSKIGKSVYFYEVDPNRIYIYRNPINISSTVGSKMTWTTWMKPDASQNGGGWFLRNGNGYDENYGLNLGSISNGKYKLSFTGYDTNFRTITTTNYIIPASEWSHVAVVYSQGEWIKVYVNGEFKEQVTWTYSPTVQATSAFSIGGHIGSTAQRFNGYLDEFKIYNDELTTSQVMIDYNLGLSTNYGAGTKEETILADGAGNTPYVEWKFDAGTGTTLNDTSGNNRSASLTAGSWKSTCHIGNCLSFNGQAGNRAVSSSNIVFSSDFTVEMWFKTDTAQTKVLMGNRGGGVVSSGFTMYINSGNTITATYGNGTASATNLNPSFAYADNKWHHLVLRVQRTSVQLNEIYIDGKMVASNTGTVAGDVGTQGLVGVGDYAGGGFPFLGLIDHISMYDYARTQAQIAYDYNRGKAVAHWKLDECQGSAANDSSGNANTGNITIGAEGTQTSAGTCTTTGAWDNGESGKYNSSMSFDGTDDFIEIPYASELELGNTGSISVWYRPTTSNSRSRAIVSYGGSASYPTGYLLNQYSTALYIYWLSGTPSMSISNFFTDMNTWYHVVLVNNNGSLTVYKNGESVGTGSSGGAITGNYSTFIGGGISNYFADSKIDDVQIFNYALSAEQVTQLKNEGMGVRFGE